MSSLCSPIPMGQYFKAVNLNIQEYVCPWCLGGGARLWEWAVSPHGAIFTLLLRKSDRSGGGDVYGSGPLAYELSGDSDDDNVELAAVILAAMSREGQPVCSPADTVIGRWAGDSVALIGDYDSSDLHDNLDSYRNISPELAREWNQFVELPQMRLNEEPCADCAEQSA